MNSIKMKVGSLENMMKTVLEKEKVLNLKSKEPRKRNTRSTKATSNNNITVMDTVEDSARKVAKTTEDSETNIAEVSDINTKKISPMSNYLCISNAPEYTCSLTQGVRSADVFFEGDFVIHLGEKHGGSKIGKVVKVFKKSVHVKTDPYAKDHQTWLMSDTIKCNRYGEQMK